MSLFHGPDTGVDAGPTGWPEPTRHRLFGHLQRWTADPLKLLAEGADRGSPFGLQLWRKAVVGFTPDWNRFVLGDLDGFRSRGSLSQLSPYLSDGVVALDAPEHRARRAAMNPTFHRRSVVDKFADLFAAAIDRALPTGEFEAAAWSSQVVRELLTIAFFGSRVPDTVIRSFLAPLDSKMPGPLLRRPIRVHRMESAIRRAHLEPTPGTLSEFFANLPGGVEEARVALAAAYDTTAHTMAFALWELAGRPELNTPAATGNVVDETLRMYPSGWIGSRVSTADTEFDGIPIPAGRLVLYSPYLTHRIADLWPEPLAFRPERFEEPRPAWGYIPFSAGERTCLGAGLATLMLRAALSSFQGSVLIRRTPAVSVRGGLTLAPGGPLVLRRRR